jgi:hypothetical protein
LNKFKNGAPVEGKIMKMIEDQTKNDPAIFRERLLLAFKECKAICKASWKNSQWYLNLVLHISSWRVPM